MQAGTHVSGSRGWPSPVPMKVMGDLVAATADSAPPPLAWPSSLVMMTWPTCTAWRALGHRGGGQGEGWVVHECDA